MLADINLVLTEKKNLIIEIKYKYLLFSFCQCLSLGSGNRIKDFSIDSNSPNVYLPFEISTVEAKPVVMEKDDLH